MIDFACKKVSLEDLVRCSFALSKTEYNLLMFMARDGFSGSASEAGKKLGLERTTIQKAFSVLLEKKLVSRRQLNLEAGGYVFSYKSIEKKALKEMIFGIVKEWHAKAQKEIDSL